MSLLTVLKGLPLAYNKDMQEDKEGMFDTVETLEGSLQMLAPMIDTMTVNKGRMRQTVNQDFSNATDIADYLVTKGVSFREAHEVIGKIVLYAIGENKFLLDLGLEEYKQFSELFEDDIYEVLAPEHVVGARKSYGGTSQEQVKRRLELAKSKLK